MTSTAQAAARIDEGFRQSNGNFDRDRLHNENTFKRSGRLSDESEIRAEVIKRAVSQLIAAVGPDIEHAVIVNDPKGASGVAKDYCCAVFGRDLLGYIEFTTSQSDPQLLVRTVSRRSITEIEIREAKDYESDRGHFVFVVHYANGIKLDIRQRDADGQNEANPGAWIEELLITLRQDLANS